METPKQNQKTQARINLVLLHYFWDQEVSASFARILCPIDKRLFWPHDICLQCLVRLTKYSVNANRTKWKMQQCCNFTPESHRAYWTTGEKAPEWSNALSIFFADEQWTYIFVTFVTRSSEVKKEQMGKDKIWKCRIRKDKLVIYRDVQLTLPVAPTCWSLQVSDICPHTQAHTHTHTTAESNSTATPTHKPEVNITASAAASCYPPLTHAHRHTHTHTHTDA